LLYAMYQKSHIFAVLIERHGAIIRQYTTRWTGSLMKRRDVNTGLPGVRT
jgi:hypothetical protein